jgi:glycosyltransferase involved in cell wall biosynthesis
MSQHITLSVIIPTFNRAAHLRRILERLRSILKAGDELIVVDGGSSDNTAGVVRGFSDIVTRFISEPDRGEAHAINKGILASRGDYLKMMSDDDDLNSDGFLQARELLERHSEIDALLCGGESYIASPEGPPQFVRFISLPEGASLEKNLWGVLFQANCGVGLFVSRRAIAYVGMLDPRFRAVDADYLARLAVSGLDFRYAHLGLYRHTEYPHSGQRQIRRTIPDVLSILARYGRWDLIGCWISSAASRRLIGKPAAVTTYRGGDGNWDGRLR